MIVKLTERGYRLIDYECESENLEKGLKFSIVLLNQTKKLNLETMTEAAGDAPEQQMQ